jgi:hypothetical protein
MASIVPSVSMIPVNMLQITLQRQNRNEFGIFMQVSIFAAHLFTQIT